MPFAYCVGSETTFFFFNHVVNNIVGDFPYLFLLYKIVLSVLSILYVHAGTGIHNTGTATIQQHIYLV